MDHSVKNLKWSRRTKRDRYGNLREGPRLRVYPVDLVSSALTSETDKVVILGFCSSSHHFITKKGCFRLVKRISILDN